MLTNEEIAWFAGLFEGEGCLEIGKNGSTRITIGMTDRDVIERLYRMIPGQKMQIVPGQKPGWSTRYVWRLGKPDAVYELLTAILPWLGERRVARTREVLHHLDTRPGTGSVYRQWTKCAKDHPYTPENTYVVPGTNERRCRTCANARQRIYNARRSAARKQR